MENQWDQTVEAESITQWAEADAEILSKVETNAANIAENARRLSQNARRIARLDNTVKKNSERLAGLKTT